MTGSFYGTRHRDQHPLHVEQNRNKKLAEVIHDGRKKEEQCSDLFVTTTTSSAADASPRPGSATTSAIVPAPPRHCPMQP